MSPDKFIPLAEDTGLIIPIGRWVMNEALRQAAAWTNEHPQAPPPHISINVSAVQLRSSSIVGHVAEALRLSGVSPTRVVLEVTESSFIECSGATIDTLRALKDLGVRLAIDDFGTGYASMAHLRQLPLDIIKIDPSFVAGLGQDDTLTLITRTVVQLGRALGLRVVAEGIEQPRQLIALREMGCDYGQGFLVARPMAAPGIEALIRTSVGAAEAVAEPREPSVSECETTRVSG
jgi:EAL domain-containing protein (putative c-di-GMP-specific phosphodiesterase class I)